MASVVSPAKQAPSGQTEGKFKEELAGVVTLPLKEVRRAGVQGRERLDVRRAAAVPRLYHRGTPPCCALQVKEKRYGETEQGQARRGRGWGANADVSAVHHRQRVPARLPSLQRCPERAQERAPLYSAPLHVCYTAGQQGLLCARGLHL